MKSTSLFLALLLASSLLHSEVKLSKVFTPHMVLQRDMNAPIWGTAAPGEEVAVEFAGQKKSTKAGADGKWSVKLDPMPASAESRTLTIGGNDTIGSLTLNSGTIGGTATLTTVQGEPLKVSAGPNGTWVITDAKGGTSTITQADVAQSNGMVHVIDTVLMP